MEHDAAPVVHPDRPLTHAGAEYLLREIERLRDELPTADEMAYLRRRKLDDERAAWAWQQVRRHAPWVAGLASAISGVVVYLATHSVTISGK